MLYADNVVIMTESSEDLQECLNAVHTYARDFRVRFIAEKPHVLAINAPEGVDGEWYITDIFIKKT